jgi:hypothetical protein
MGTIAEKDFAASLFFILKETFEGPPPRTSSAYLDQGGGLFQTIENVTAEDASRAVWPGAPTVAAHCAHVKFYLDVLQRYMRGSSEQADWKQSWLVQTVGAAEWEALKVELREAYSATGEALRAVEDWGGRPVGAALAVVAHTAYHLGAVRQLARGLKGDQGRHEDAGRPGSAAAQP